MSGASPEVVRVEEMAALYLFGVLPPQDVVEFECRLKAGDTHCAEALRLANESVPALAYLAPPVAPPPSLRARLMRRIAVEHHAAGLGALRKQDQGEWIATRSPGVSYKRLYSDKAAGLVTSLVRMEPGAVYPAHVHQGVEQCLVLEGDLWHEQDEYGPGDFTWAEAHSLDPELRTVGGTLLLIISGR